MLRAYCVRFRTLLLIVSAMVLVLLPACGDDGRGPGAHYKKDAGPKMDWRDFPPEVDGQIT